MSRKTARQIHVLIAQGVEQQGAGRWQAQHYAGDGRAGDQVRQHPADRADKGIDGNAQWVLNHQADRTKAPWPALWLRRACPARRGDWRA